MHLLIVNAIQDFMMMEEHKCVNIVIIVVKHVPIGITIIAHHVLIQGLY